MNADRREWLIATIISLGHGSQHFFSRIIPPLIPILAIELALPLWKLGMFITVYSLGNGFGQTPMGILSDKYDRRYILPPGLGVLSGSYVLFALAPSIGAPLPTLSAFGYSLSGPFLVMNAAMLIGGFGASVVHPTGYPLISSNVSDDKKGRSLGMWGSAAKAGDALAPALIGVLILTLAWSQILLLFAVAGVLFAVAMFVLFGMDDFDTLPPEHASNQTDADDEETRDAGPTVWEIDPRLFIYPMAAVLIFFVARMVATQGVNTFVPAFITDVYGYSLTIVGFHFEPPSLANFYFSLLLLTAAIVQLWTGTLTDRYDHRPVLLGFLGVTAVALALLAYVRLPPVPLLIVLLVVGGGLWGLNPARDALISDITPPEREGRTFGYLWTVAHVIGSFTPVVIGFVAELSGIQRSFQWLAAATFVALLAITLLYSDRVYMSADSTADSSAD